MSPTDGAGPRATAAARRPVIAGLGLTEVGKVYGRTAASFAADAVRLAADDCRIAISDVDGLLVSSGVTGGTGLALARDLGLRDLALLTEMQAYGSTAGQMVQYAAMAVMTGTAEVVACVFADDPLKQGQSTGSAYSGRAGNSGFPGLLAASGVTSTTQMYALAARRHMATYGTTHEQLGHVAVAQREWAALNPVAQMRTPISLEDHASSRVIADPFHLLDCCLVSNGGAAVIVTTAERAAALAQPAVPVLGWGQSHPGRSLLRNDDFGLVTGAVQSGRTAFEMAGLTVADVDVAEIYDCYTFTALVTLEDYGFCKKGEGGELVASGVLGPNGTLPVNTGGGQLSSYYLWGMTPLTEAVVQARGQAGARQVPTHDVVLVSGNGGVLDHHCTLVLGSAAAA